MHYAAESLDMGITQQIGVLLQSALLYFCVIQLHDGSHGDIHISNDTAVLLGRGFTASLSLFLSVCFS